MKEEYTRETYPSFGKKYNSEKAIISLTSWRARINTVSKTLFSLVKQCPGFHIVLVLSEEEFPKMMDELPENLKVFAENELIEILWVYKNYKAFKKVLFTMDKYRDVPVISADDDCIYTCNYAQILYDEWKKNKTSIVSVKTGCENGYAIGPYGCGTLYYPNYFSNEKLRKIINLSYTSNLDDFVTAVHCKHNHIKIISKNLLKNIIFINQNGKRISSPANRNKTKYYRKKILELFKSIR